MPSDEQKRLLTALKRFGKQLKDSTERLEWRKWRIWYRDYDKLNGIDWLYVYAQHEQQAREFACEVRHKELDITQIEEVP